MSHDRSQDDAGPQEPGITDESLRAALPSYGVPEPGGAFVDDTLLRVQLQEYEVPGPSSGFVDRVVARIMDEAGSADDGGAQNNASDTLEIIPLKSHSRHEGSQLAPIRDRGSFPRLLGIVGIAAALLLAFFIGRQSVNNIDFSDEALVRIEEFPARGSNRFARSLSLVVDRVESHLTDQRHRAGQDAAGPRYPRPVLSLPAPPSRLIPSALVEGHVDRETLRSLGIEVQKL